ncbi:hypothetical protein AC578_2565 [Pseudocercospora eumusae]|uniref:Uncharacterized protein n=1 Tax=Pseudocercospora eumusae TaxID=321146 RepID=A0A139HHI2_9PEZI|nr:hypothetical protein AC578_2565 [Pseudocercospora eumusae]
MGSVGENIPYSVPKEAERIFEQEIINNPLVPELPADVKEAAKLVHFTGNALPSIPINWRFAESAAALKAFEASMLNLLRARKYGAPFSKVDVNTDHASLFVMSPMLAQIVGQESSSGGQNVFNADALAKVGIQNCDLHRASASPQRSLVTNIYKTKDGRYYHVHGSMNPDPSLTALGQPLDGDPEEDYDSAVKRFQDVVGQWNSKDLDELMNEKYRQAGTICWSKDEFFQTEHGKANAHVGLYEIQKAAESKQAASWWPENSSNPSSAKRPLAGLKVVDLTRVIAAPAVTRGLAELGASVIRVTSPHVTDLSGVHQDLNWGKWTAFLHLKNEEDRLKLVELIKEADIVVEGYRPSVMEKYGLSRKDIFELVKDRERGMIHVKENCYGWHGPWQHRSGWQQISDACCGTSLAYGRAMGNDEAVTPIFPNSDYCTGIAGACAILHALMKRGEEGGSYGVDVSLNYYSQWLVRSVGEYPKDVWNEVWSRHGSPVYRHYHSMQYTLPSMIGLLKKHDSKTLFNPAFFEQRTSKAVGHDFIVVKPIADYHGEVELKYNVGTRGNGYDKAYWPENLLTEVLV